MLNIEIRKQKMTCGIESVTADLETLLNALEGGPSAEFLKKQPKKELITTVSMHILNLKKLHKYTNDMYKNYIEVIKEVNQ